MTHEEEIERAEKLEAAARRAFRAVPKAKPEPGQTYHGRSMLGLDGDGAIGTGSTYVIGSEATTVNAPLPQSPIQWDNNPEPPTGDLYSLEDMTVFPYGGSPPPPAPADEAVVPPEPDAADAEKFQRRFL
jgi:hypothetical protein